jgi:glycosyltransferase involved in cell wall biosynthesis
MPTLHFFRWTEQLENSGHDVYWFDIVDGIPTKRLPWVKKKNGWKVKYPNLKGRYFVKNKLPFLYKMFSPLIEEKPATAFEEYLNKIKPDVVHSFVLYISCTPIFSVMLKNKNLPWIYSAWGSDLYYFKEFPKYRRDIQKILPRIDYLITDCKRDVKIAKTLGFNKKVLATLPGGGGFNFKEFDKYIVSPTAERRTVLVKGYQGRSGRCIPVLKALKLLSHELRNYKVIVFGADEEVIKFSSKNNLNSILNLSIYSKSKFLPHKEIMKLMGEALIYIGNSNSDGMPNTLLEAIGMGAFPIQSNPGGSTQEVLTHKENGLLITDIENIEELRNLILLGLSNSKLVEKAFIINQMELKANYEREKIKRDVLKAYNFVAKKLN